MSLQKAEKANTVDTSSILEVGNMSSSEDMENAYEELVEELVDEVVDGRNSENFQELMDTLAVAGTYSARNKFLIKAQNPDVIGPFNGYNQWINEFGRVPEEGSEALWILAPVMVTYCEETDQRAKYCDECDGKCEETYKVMVDCKSVTTFAYSQTVELSEEDKPEDTKDISVISEKTAEATADNETIHTWYQNLVQSYENKGFDVSEIDDAEDWKLSTGARGFFEHGDRGVTVRNFKVRAESESVDIAERFSTLAHEVAHSLLRHDEENLSDAKKELEAEAVAYIVCQRLGIQTDAGVYIANHLHNEADVTDRENVRELIEDSIERIGEISSQILEGVR